MASWSPMNNADMHQGPLANRPKVQYGGGEHRRGKRIGGVARVVDGVPPRESSIDAYRQQQINSNLAKAQEKQNREAQERALRVSQAKANGTFQGIQQTFNNSTTAQVMDDNGIITPTTRKQRVDRAKADGTFPAIRDKFNNSNTTQMMDENGDIRERPQGNGGWFGLMQKAKDIMDGMPKPNTDNPTIPARAKGGPVKRGRPYLVGEKGPELVVPEEDGVVIPNEVLRKKGKKGRGGKCAAKDKAAWFAREARRWMSEK